MDQNSTQTDLLLNYYTLYGPGSHCTNQTTLFFIRISDVLHGFSSHVERLGFDENYIDISHLVEERLQDSTSSSSQSQSSSMRQVEEPTVSAHVYCGEGEAKPCLFPFYFYFVTPSLLDLFLDIGNDVQTLVPSHYIIYEQVGPNA